MNMDASNIVSFISKAAPYLGTLIGGPVGTAIGTLAGTGINMVAAALGVEPNQDAVAQAIATDPAAAEKLREFELNNKLELQKLIVTLETKRIEADTAVVHDVNTTMQAETIASPSQTWYQKAWRPANGFCVALGSFSAVLFVCFLFYTAITNPALVGGIGGVLNVLPALALSITSILAIPGAAVGITAWHRGMMQREEQTNSVTGAEQPKSITGNP
jgi:hypothetical protein